MRGYRSGQLRSRRGGCYQLWGEVSSALLHYISNLITFLYTPAILAPSEQDILNQSLPGLMLGQRRRQWANIKPALDRCVVSAGLVTT